ncbi:hypothetical protein N9L66_00490 [Porticoccaceae bacterium]|nr:hypothetical protein [Porticoccaceae bacterium]MDA8682062.1 hypothetical protein [Porticoccaceae bacterium]MDB2343080.1 hypothetical protein [Porticoccaceae bacterium]MDB2664405.1 hypothetical protein [Porticoccaceae bacterium]
MLRGRVDVLTVIVLVSMMSAQGFSQEVADGESSQGGCVDSTGCPIACWRADEEKAQNTAIKELTKSFEDESPPPHSETSCISDYSQIGLEVSADLLTLPSLADLFDQAIDVACEATDSYLRSIIKRSDLAMDLPLGASIDVDLYNGGEGVDLDLDWGQGLIDELEDVVDDTVNDAVDDVFDDPPPSVPCFLLPPNHPNYCDGDIDVDINDIW